MCSPLQHGIGKFSAFWTLFCLLNIVQKLDMGEDDFDMDETNEVEGQLFNLKNLSWPNVPTFS